MPTQAINVIRLYRTLDRKRNKLKMTWRQMGRLLGISASVFTHMSKGKRPDVDTFVTLLHWLESPHTPFTTQTEKVATRKRKEKVAAE